MSLSSIGSSTDISQIASRLMDSVDANRDGQLSKQEFGSFLTSLLSGMSPASPTSPANAAIASGGVVRAATLVPNYSPIPGFDTSKMNDLSHNTVKYQFARAVQDLGLLGAPTTANLQTVVDGFNRNGGKATVTGDDTIDFGDGFGPVDVIFSVGGNDARWQWCPTT